MSNACRLIVHLPGAVDSQGDREVAEAVRGAVEEGLRERYTEIDYIEIQEVPPPKDRADIKVGTRVVVTPYPIEEKQPYTARVHGYDMGRTKYRLDRELSPGSYTKDGLYWAFVGQVERHPDNEN